MFEEDMNTGTDVAFIEMSNDYHCADRIKSFMSKCNFMRQNDIVGFKEHIEIRARSLKPTMSF